MEWLELLKLLSDESTRVTNEQLKNSLLDIVKYSALCDGVIIVMIITCVIALIWDDSKIRKRIKKLEKSQKD